MTADLCIALSLAPALSRVGLTTRLQDPDPLLLDLAYRFLPKVAALRLQGERRRRHRVGSTTAGDESPKFNSKRNNADHLGG